jgi:hypothetical protein
MKYTMKRQPRPTLNIGERWCESFLVTFPVTYRYNGLVEVDGKLHSGFKVPAPKVPKGFKLVTIGCGLQLNARPPHATVYLKPLDGNKVTKKELKKILSDLT